MSLNNRQILIMFLLWCCFVYSCGRLLQIAENLHFRLNTIEQKMDHLTPNKFRNKGWTRSGYNWLTSEIDEIILKNCKKFNINPKVVYALIEFESGRYCKGDLNYMKVVRSHAGAIGLMQIMPIHARVRGLYPSALEDPELNIKIGVSYLAEQMRIAKMRGYKHIMLESLRMYNQGPGRGDGYAHRIKYRNWSNYVFPILSRSGETQLCQL
jgi:hypothetical protein